MVIALIGPVGDGKAEYGVGSVEYSDQTPVSSLWCHIPGALGVQTKEVQPEDLELGGCVV